MGKIFELYRRVAMGNGDTGTPVPRPAIFFEYLEVYGSMKGTIIVNATLRNAGMAPGAVLVTASGTHTLDGDTYVDSIVFSSNISATIPANESITRLIESNSFGGPGQSGTATVIITLTVDGVINNTQERNTTWSYPGMGQG